MKFFQGLLTARSHLAFLAGLAGALGAIWGLETSGLAAPEKSAPPPSADFAAALHLDARAVPALRPTGEPLTDVERAWAQAAWRYFENNYQPATGFTNSVDGYPSTTLWDLGSYLMGLIAAHELGVVDAPTFDARAQKLLGSLLTLPLVDGALPNKAYDTRTMAMVRYDNTEVAGGIGWSALDVARIGVPFTILCWQYPRHTAAVRAALSRWKLEQMAAGGQMFGARRAADGALERVQEGRFGYEQYGAKSLFLLGQDVSRSLRYDAGVRFADVSGQRIAYDARLPAAHQGTHNAVLSEPYLLEAIEYGLDQNTRSIAASVFLAQRARHAQTGILTAVSEDNIDRAPYFVYDSVLNAGKPWAAFTPDGADADAHRTLSLKAALGWSYLFTGDYADRLRAAAGELVDPARGFYSGRYERGGAQNRAITANTNGIVLETLLYKVRGPLLRAARQSAPSSPTN